MRAGASRASGSSGGAALLPGPVPPGAGSGPVLTAARSRARDEIIRLQQALFRRQRRLIAERVHGYTPEFRRYEQRYRRAVASFERPATVDEIVDAAAAADVVYVGDYHTLEQAQRAYVKLLRRLAERGRPLVVALEFVQGRAQQAVDRFVRGRLSERTFLERIRYRQHHVFDIWPHFRPVFDTARGLDLPVLALERSGGTLAERDRYAARRIARALQAHRGSLVLVLTGQLHCTPAHLPRRVRAEALQGGLAVRDLVVYQNADSIWWSLERQGLEHETEAVLVRRGEYALVNTSPVVAQQSWLDWVESEGEVVYTDQPERHFKELARVIAEFLDIDLGDALDRVQVHTADDVSFLERLGDKLSPRELSLVRRRILARESMYIPQARVAYLAHLSINHAAEEAAHFLHHVVTGDPPDHDVVDAFYRHALEEAYAFFGSKIANPRRKCAHVEDWERARRGADAHERQIADLVLAHKALEQGRPRRTRRPFAALDADLFNAATHALGYMLGDKLYYAMIRGHVPKERVRELFLDPLDEEGAALHAYCHLARMLERVRVPRHA